jgi:hypothetical protein
VRPETFQRWFSSGQALKHTTWLLALYGIEQGAQGLCNDRFGSFAPESSRGAGWLCPEFSKIEHYPSISC